LRAYPFISILLAVRNEENNIIRCLECLDKLNYPSDRLEILIGNDASTDQTKKLITIHTAHNSRFKLFEIEQGKDGLKGKANVLAQLARFAQGEYYFFCDADIAVPADWINNMLRHFKPGIGVVNGITIMKPSGLYADFQSLEWILALGSFRILSYFGIGVTSMGNNMAISAQAYRDTGGYETIGFSVVEDYTLFREILNNGYQFIQTFESGVTAFSEPVPNIESQIIQRKRWMQGAMQVPGWMIGLFFAGALFPLLCLTLLPFFSFWPAILLLTSYIFITGFTGGALLLLNQTRLLKALPVFWFYLSAMNLVSIISYFKGGKVVWKGREF